MEYYKPAQNLGFTYFRKTGEVYIKSHIAVLTHTGESLTKLNSPFVTYLIQYRMINDANIQNDAIFRDEISIRADAKITGAVIDEVTRREAQLPGLPKNVTASVKVEVYLMNGTLGGTVTSTTTINDDADIEVR